MPTVLVTGCSSGFGLAIARHFLDHGWSAVAAMRNPQDDLLPASDRLRILQLDVTDPESIRSAFESAGPIDVLVNNAGIGVMDAVETTPVETMREIFETNAIGLMAVTAAVIPQFRERKAGVIVNIGSAVTLAPFPLLGVYTASKAAVNAVSQSLAVELAPFNVRVHVILPGQAPETAFSASAMTRLPNGFTEPYVPLAENIFAAMQGSSKITYAADVTEAVWQAATDDTAPPMLPAGADAEELMRAFVG